MKRYSQEFNKRINAVISLLNEFKIKNYEFLSNLYNFIFRLKKKINKIMSIELGENLKIRALFC